MKSIIIKDIDGSVIVKIIHRKNGKFEALVRNDLQDKLYIEARDDDNKKVWFVEE